MNNRNFVDTRVMFSIVYMDMDAHLRRKTLIPWRPLDRPPDGAFEARTTLELVRVYIYCLIFNEIQIRRAPFGFSLCFQRNTDMQMSPGNKLVNITQLCY